jgi:MFS family permease
MAGQHIMTQPQLKAGYFILEGLNSLSTTFFQYYLFFYLQQQFGFGDADNLWVSALNGLVYMAGAALAGRFAQRAGPYTALRIGFGVMISALLAGAFQATAFGVKTVLVVWSAGMCFTWPTLESMTSQGESRQGLQRMVGIYNLVWAGCSALAFFLGGTLLHQFGMRSLFWIPIGIHFLQIVMLEWLHRQTPPASAAAGQRVESALSPSQPAHVPSGLAPGVFLKMAWIANPFCYVAINTVVAVIPGLTKHLNLTMQEGGIFCSIWFFARLVSFVALWLWSGWHYRFSWLAGAFAALIASFLAILLSTNIGLAILAQIVFGFATGLCYYSSLFYSMDVGGAKSEHGGLHESAIGAGVCAGPALGASALYLWPRYPNAGAWAVAVLLLIGGGVIVTLRAQAKKAS